MNRHWRALLIVIAVICFGVALSYPIRYRMAQESNNSELESLAAMRQRVREAESVRPNDALSQGGENPASGAQEAAESQNDAAASSRAVETLQSEASQAGENGAATPETPEQGAPSQGGDQPGIPPEGGETNEPGQHPESGEGTESGQPPESGEGAEPGQSPESGGGVEPGIPPDSGEGAEPGQPLESGEGVEPGQPPESGEGAEPGQPPESGGGVEPGQPPENGGGNEPGQPPESGEGEPTQPPQEGGAGPAGSQPPPEAPAETPVVTPSPVPTPTPTPTPGLMDLLLELPETAPPEANVAQAPNETPAPSPTPDRSIRYGAQPYPDKEKVRFDEAKILPELLEIYEINRDLIGWLEIPGTVIDYPVVQADNGDFYLSHDFYGNDNINGQIILDPLCDPYTPSYNLIISGHHMKNGSMFGDLPMYSMRSYWQKHMFFEFDTLMTRKQYVVFACFYSADYDEDEEGFRYNADIRYKLEVDRWLEEIKENQLFDTGIDVEFGDEFITLTTCNRARHRNGRFVVVGRKVREGETFE